MRPCHHGNPVAELVGFFHVVVVSRMVCLG